jgi:ketosteroid isomerase-like protein
MMRTVQGTTAWNPDGQRIASSDDLGCTWGILERRAAVSAEPDSSVYLHVWRRGGDGRWKVALALENPLPKATGK